MEFIINIIILLVIVSSVLKRFNEVSKKAKDLGNDSSGPTLSDLFENKQITKRLQEVIGEQKTEELQTNTEPIYPDNESFDKTLSTPLQETWEQEQAMTQESEFSTEDIFEQVHDAKQELENMRLAYSSYDKAIISDDEQRRVSVTERLTFSRSSVISGIVMSEILGPPITIRHTENHW